ncbi:MAG: phosphodiester glycosidase family protein [Caulobacteraceae bacterium]
MNKTSTRKRYLSKALAFLIILSMLLSGMVYSQDTASVAEKGQDIGPGTYYRNLDYITPNGKFVINMLETNIGTEYIKIEASHGNGTIVNKTVTAQALQKNNNDQRVIGAINGDFFDMTLIKGLTYSTSIIDGEIITAVPKSTILGITNAGNCFIDILNMKGTLTYKDRQAEINTVNRLRWADQTILYTPRFGKTTQNTIAGADIVVKGVELPLVANKTYTGTIESINSNAKNTAIPADGVVISVQGSAINTFTGAMPGDSISFSINADKPDLKYAVSGSPRLLEKGQLSPDIVNRPDGKERHPRSAVGIKDNKLFLVAVDGRQPGVSDGMTLYEFTEFLLSQGIQDAINLDGGGSTTLAARKQGDAVIKLANVPSDGRERSVGNSIQIISTAPVSEPAFIKFNSEDIKIYKNSSFKPSFYVLDKYYNLLQVDATKAKYGVDTKTAKISGDGTYTSGSNASKSYLDVTFENAKGRLPVEIVDKVSKVMILNDFVHLDPGEKVQMWVKAFDESGREVFISPSAVKWTVDGGIGTVDSKGVFTAGKKLGNGKINAVLGEAKSTVDAKNGKTPTIIADFGVLNNVEAKFARGKAAIRHNQKGEPVKTGKISLKLDYSFENTAETSAAYVTFKQPVRVIGKPTEIGAWVYGDGSSHWLRGAYINAQGERKVFNLTEEGVGINWKGWKYVYTDIPQDEKFPIALDQIYIAEPQQDKKNAGSIYFDDVMAIYKPGTDYYDPTVTSVTPENLKEIDASPTEIAVNVQDRGTGINPKSIKMFVNDKPVKFKFDPKLGKITYIPSKSLASGNYKVKVTLKDKAGNLLNPELNFSFKVK